MTASNTVFTVFSGFGLVLSLIPLWWHLESWNVGTCMFMIWTALASFVYFVDSILWSGNTINWAPVWCDIVIRVQIGVSVAWPACSLCIIRRLYYITCTVPIDQAEKRRAMICDLLITVGIPVLQMAIEYVVAGHRFNIVEDFGCLPATWNTPLAYALVLSWPLIIGIVSAGYGAFTIRAFLKRRKQLKGLISANSNLAYNIYWRLIALASVDFCFTIPIAVRTIVVAGLLGPLPWVSWADTHSGYSRIVQIPRIVVNQHPILVYSYEITRWAAVLCAFVFFGFFGFASEARRNYRLLASRIAEFLGFTLFTESTPTPDSRIIDHSLRFALPVSITQQTVSRRVSDLFSDKLSTGVNKFDLEVQHHSSTAQPNSADPLSPSIDEIPRLPELVLDPAFVRGSFYTGTYTYVHRGDALGR